MRILRKIIAAGHPGILSTIAIGLMISVASLAEDQHEPSNEGREHSFHRNTVGGFIGFTGEDDREGGGRDRAVTLGIEYQRRFSEEFGVIVELERAFGDLDFTVVSVPLVYYLEPWAVSAGPGVEFTDDGEEEFVFRVAGVYVFDRGGYELAPKAGLDFVAGEVVFFAGLVVGFGF